MVQIEEMGSDKSKDGHFGNVSEVTASRSSTNNAVVTPPPYPLPPECAEKDGVMCACRDCFYRWWFGLSQKWKVRITSWKYYIDLNASAINQVNKSKSEPQMNDRFLKNKEGDLQNDDEVEIEPFDDEEPLEIVIKPPWKGFGVRLFDDNIDIYCDRLQRAIIADGEWKLEGCMAIQYIHGDYGQLGDVISGTAMVLQVIYDESRTGHFILLEWTPETRVVRIYDSLVPDDDGAKHTMTQQARRQIIALFGHLYQSTIPIHIERNIEEQTDGWSCGLRVIGFITRRALRYSATGYHYNIELVEFLMRLILDKPNASLEDFRHIHVCCNPFSIYSYPIPPLILELDKNSTS